MNVDWYPDRRTLRWFSALLIVAAAVLAWRFTDSTAVVATAALAAMTGIAGVLLPAAALPMWRLLNALTWPLRALTSFVVLAAVWLFVVTPIGLLLRASGRKLIDDPESSGWRERTEDLPQDFLRQF